MTVQIASTGPVDLAYETFGAEDDPTIVLVMGLATQMLGWPDGFCTSLADKGFQVIRFDNRDIGLSTHCHEAGAPNVGGLFGPERAAILNSSPYLLADMADDTARLLDALGLDRVHIVGASMGGMIVQEFAIRHPQRLLSMTSIMSTTAPHVGAPTQAAMAALLSPPASTEDEAGERAVAVYRVIGSPGYPLDEEGMAQRARDAFRRSNDPAGVARQLVAIHASGDRTELLGAVAVPTLVIHGEGDQLVQPDGGRATAAAVPDAELLLVPGMGHDLPQALWPTLVSAIITNARKA